jgi:hypothetical protein
MKNKDLKYTWSKKLYISSIEIKDVRKILKDVEKDLRGKYLNIRIHLTKGMLTATYYLSIHTEYSPDTKLVLDAIANNIKLNFVVL